MCIHDRFNDLRTPPRSSFQRQTANRKSRIHRSTDSSAEQVGRPVSESNPIIRRRPDNFSLCPFRRLDRSHYHSCSDCDYNSGNRDDQTLILRNILVLPPPVCHFLCILTHSRTKEANTRANKSRRA